MLARANRVVRPEDFRAVVRRGRRSTTPGAIYYRLDREPADPLRFGFIVSRAVGGAGPRVAVARGDAHAGIEALAEHDVSA